MKNFFRSEKFSCLLISIFFTAVLTPGQSNSIQVNDTINSSQIKDTLSSSQVKDSNSTIQVKDTLRSLPGPNSTEGIILGERLFYGLVYPDSRSINCAGCHNTRVSDTLNWNPDAVEISVKYQGKSASELGRVLLKPAGKKMSQVHKGFQLTAEEIEMLKGFMDKLAVLGLKHQKPVVTYLLLLIIASLLFVVSSVDLIIKRIFKYQTVNLVLISLTGTFIVYILAVNAIAFGRSVGFSPDQPVKFSHAVHAGQNKTDCLYCHYSARTSKTAGIPSGNICLNCHFLVRTGTRSGVTEITKVLEAHDKKYPVEWVRIYKLPDFVFFSHAQHVNAGEIACETCHGPVKEMDRLIQVPNLAMGWCIKCHDSRKVNIENVYYQTYYPSLYNSVKTGKADSVMVTGIGGRDCGKCHY
jgi:hypothetical protein